LHGVLLLLLLLLLWLQLVASVHTLPACSVSGYG